MHCLVEEPGPVKIVELLKIHLSKLLNVLSCGFSISSQCRLGCFSRCALIGRALDVVYLFADDLRL